MSRLIVDGIENVTLVGGGAASSADLETLRPLAPRIVAADGGARHLLAMGLMPDAVIGDFDSIGQEAQHAIPAERLHHIAEQDSTDFEKCLSRIRAPLVLGLGFMGPRTDHQLAAFHGLIRCADQPCILVGDTQIVFLCPPEISLEVEEGGLVSLFPLARVSARSEGLRWPIDGLDLAPDRVVGTSNRADASKVRLSCDVPGLLVILPRGQLDPSIRALQTLRARWPSRAERHKGLRQS